MIQLVTIDNYALIDHLEINFDRGFSTITGETGAGKSILLGALSLILGQRADANSLKDKSRKCFVEAEFNIKEYHLHNFFKRNDIDYDDNTFIRREINTSGKSRAFINDTPVNLVILKELGEKLVDIHSQHQNLILNDNAFQLRIVDVFANHLELLTEYRQNFKKYQTLNSSLKDLQEKSDKAKSDLDYFQFQFNQLEEANLTESEQEEFERELETLNHAEEIKTQLVNSSHLLTGEGAAILDHLKEAKDSIDRLNSIFSKSEEFSNRLESTYIELKDIAEGIEELSREVEFNPERIEFINQRLDLIYSLQQKHRVATVQELLEIQEKLQSRLNEITSYDSELESLQKEIDEVRALLESQSTKLSNKRKKMLPDIEKGVISKLHLLGMPNAVLKVDISNTEDFTNNGVDKVNFLFSANKQGELQEISKVASGGEVSRVMLTFKSLISQSKGLPTIVFDEIDTGVSGDIADKMGNIMQQMGEGMQVISITHLPQIASKGRNHYVVYKKDGETSTYTNIKQLNKEERIVEIAKMLSGKDLSEAAVENAKSLLNI